MFTNDQFLTNYGTFAPSEPQTNRPFFDENGTPLRDVIGERVMGSHPLEIVNYLQRLWDAGRVKGEPAFPQYAVQNLTPYEIGVSVLSKSRLPHSIRWFHLIYAFLIENTRIYEVFRKVIDAFVHGETLGVASPETLRWIKTTEALFFRQEQVHDHLTPIALTSDARGHGCSIRRNAYHRFFSMDLSHESPEKYNKAKTANREFVSVLQDLFRELWVARIYSNSTSTANPTDDGAIEDLMSRMFVMLQNRRLNETLRVEEFSAVATLDWLRLAVSFDSPIVKDLRAEATSESERLHKIAERVGLPANNKSQEYFELAAPMSFLLQGIETRSFSDRLSLLNGLGSQFPLIITNWSSATGLNLKTSEPERKNLAA